MSKDKKVYRYLTPSNHIFTRPRKSLPPGESPLPRVDPDPIVPDPPLPPSGPRSSWTRNQYIQYKAEKKDYCLKEQAKRDRISETDLEKKYKIYGNKPINTATNQMFTSRIVLGEKLEVKTKPKWWQKEPSTGVWQTPDTDGEDELGPLRRKPRYDHMRGRVMVHDNWPSEWRKKVALQVNDAWINQTVSFELQGKVRREELIYPGCGEKSGVNVAQLMSLKHALVVSFCSCPPDLIRRSF